MNISLTTPLVLAFTVASLGVSSAQESTVSEQPTPLVTVPSLPAPVIDTVSLGDTREAAGVGAPITTLEEAIARTLSNNPQRVLARASLAAAEARIRAARSQGGPQIGITYNGNLNRNGGSINNNNNNGGNGNNNTGQTFAGFDDSQTVNLAADIPVYSGGRVRAGTRVARFNAQSQAAQALQVEQNLVLAATNGYLAILRNEQLLQVADSNLAVSRTRQRVAEVRYEAGASARLDVYTANTTLADAAQLRVSASNNLATSKANLNTLMAKPPETPLRVEEITTLDLRIPLPADLSELLPASSGDLRASAEKNRPSLAAAAARENSAASGVDAARAQRRPNLGLSISGLFRNPANFLGHFALSLGLSVAQGIFDSGRVSAQVQEAREVLNQARASAGAERLDVANNIEAALLSLDSAQGRLTSADTAVAAGMAALDAARLGYEAGARTSLDVSDAQAALLAAQTNAVNARFDVAQSQAQLSSAVGILSGEGQAAYNQVVQDELKRAGIRQNARN